MSAGGDELGEITVSVTAEGTEEAAQDAAEATSGGDGGGGGGGGRGGIFAEILSVLGVLSVLRVLEPIGTVMEAFVAPVMAVFLRLLSPVLRWLIRLLPAWYSFVQDPAGFIADGVQFLFEKLTELPGLIWDFMTDLPQLIWDKFKGAVGTLAKHLSRILGAVRSIAPEGAAGGIEASGGPILPTPAFDIARRLAGAVGGGAGAGAGGAGLSSTGASLNLSLEGGLGAFVSRIYSNDNVEVQP